MEPDELVYFKPFREIQKTSNYLPHWQQPGAAYFITYRLAGAIPASLRSLWESERDAWLQHHPKPWSQKQEMEYHQRFTRQIEHWLDAGHGSCVLRDPARPSNRRGELALVR